MAHPAAQGRVASSPRASVSVAGAEAQQALIVGIDRDAEVVRRLSPVIQRQRARLAARRSLDDQHRRRDVAIMLNIKAEGLHAEAPKGGRADRGPIPDCIQRD